MRHLVYKDSSAKLHATFDDHLLHRSGLLKTINELPLQTLIRVEITPNDDPSIFRPYIRVGRVVPDPAKVAAQYAETPVHCRADTASPGIQGFQQRADAAACAGYEAQSRSRQLGRWIEAHVLPDLNSQCGGC